MAGAAAARKGQTTRTGSGVEESPNRFDLNSSSISSLRLGDKRHDTGEDDTCPSTVSSRRGTLHQVTMARLLCAVADGDEDDDDAVQTKLSSKAGLGFVEEAAGLLLCASPILISCERTPPITVANTVRWLTFC